MNSCVVNSDFTRDEFLKMAEALYDQHKYITFSWQTGKQRSLTQNRALHLYCRMLADALNDAGLDMRKVLKEEVDMPWNERTVKEFLWRPIQIAVTGHESTTQPKRAEYEPIYQVLYRHLAQKLGVMVEWPRKENIA